MKTKIEIEGYEIEVQLENGVISVKAEKDDEVVEEFTIQTEEVQDEEGSEEVQGFEDFGGEEEDFEGEESLEGEEDIMDDEAQGAALESFQSFINKRK
jgi:hypothetical protein